MEGKKLYNLEELIELRHYLHKIPELFYQEVNTSKTIIENLKKLGIQDSQIKRVAKTGIIVDMYGQGPKSGKKQCIAIRADMDGLPIKEVNTEIDYVTTTNAAHMCGHDSHMTCAIGGTAKILEKIDQIPEDKCIRLLFQPAEERIGGAFPMIQEGALDGVDEVYGFHNWPFEAPGKVYCKPGYMMAASTKIDITIHGKGGHASEFDKLNDPIQAAVDIHNEFRTIYKSWKDKGTNFSLCLPVIHCGDAPNVIANTCEMRGTMRSFEDEVTLGVKKELYDAVQRACQKNGCTADSIIETKYPSLKNTETEAENVIRVAKKVVGEENVDGKNVPVRASEDFAFFTQVKPGAFFFLSSARKSDDILHSTCFNVHDDMIAIGCEMWFRLVEDRFGLTFK